MKQLYTPRMAVALGGTHQYECEALATLRHTYLVPFHYTKGLSKVYEHSDQKGSNPLSIPFLTHNLNLLISLKLLGSNYLLQGFCFQVLAIYLFLLK